MANLLARIEAAGGSVWCDGNTLRYRLPEGQAALVAELRQHKLELVDALRHEHQISEDSALWLSGFQTWLREHCAFRDDCYGGIPSLCKDFNRYLNGLGIEECSCGTFTNLLRQELRSLQDGGLWTENDIERKLIYGLILRGDLESKPKPEIGDPASRPHPDLKAPNAKHYRIVKRQNVLGPVDPSERGTMFDPAVFIPYTLDQLQAALDGDANGSGGWSVPILVARLHAFGVIVELTR